MTRELILVEDSPGKWSVLNPSKKPARRGFALEQDEAGKWSVLPPEEVKGSVWTQEEAMAAADAKMDRV